MSGFLTCADCTILENENWLFFKDSFCFCVGNVLGYVNSEYFSFSFFHTSHSLDFDRWPRPQLTHFGGLLHLDLRWACSLAPQFSQTEPIFAEQLSSWCPNCWQLKHLIGFGILISTGIKW